jgi:hypothetical protein
VLLRTKLAGVLLPRNIGTKSPQWRITGAETIAYYSGVDTSLPTNFFKRLRAGSRAQQHDCGTFAGAVWHSLLAASIRLLISAAE